MGNFLYPPVHILPEDYFEYMEAAPLEFFVLDKDASYQNAFSPATGQELFYVPHHSTILLRKFVPQNRFPQLTVNSIGLSQSVLQYNALLTLNHRPVKLCRFAMYGNIRYNCPALLFPMRLQIH